MSKLFNVYSNDVDKTWYKSSNILYSECVDKEGELKTLRVVFSNGGQYEYRNVDVRDYLMFRDSESQGKTLNTHIIKKGYEFSKLEKANIETINEEYMFRTNDGTFLDNTNNFKVKNKSDEVVFELSKQLDEDTFNLVNDILNAVGIKTKMIL